MACRLHHCRVVTLSDRKMEAWGFLRQIRRVRSCCMPLMVCFECICSGVGISTIGDICPWLEWRPGHLERTKFTSPKRTFCDQRRFLPESMYVGVLAAHVGSHQEVKERSIET